DPLLDRDACDQSEDAVAGSAEDLTGAERRAHSACLTAARPEVYSAPPSHGQRCALRKVVVCRMPGVRVKEGESFENAMKRFKKQCEKAGILSEIRKREHYEKPSVKRKKKALAAKKRALKKARKGMM